ncbi:hypothetical protein [Catenovulum maritimum]|uniref:Lipoprotein n=1 Tax=Catenovulum maritimum TaxID=1513271 RepID=A0A0J8JLZ5_9ALTE|nr:hypothetical protein [Catenovulum maritimum]KMT65586.1 hypothetical protein XM47_07765 [Catenovulum maritimum]
MPKEWVLRLSCLLLFCTSTGCASNKETIKNTQLEASRAQFLLLKQSDSASLNLKKLAKLEQSFAKHDDLDNLWQVYYLTAKLHYQNKNTGQASNSIQQCINLTQFFTNKEALQTCQIFNVFIKPSQTQIYSEILVKPASNHIETLVLAYSGEIDLAFEKKEAIPKENLSERAYLYYMYGKKHADKDNIKLALNLFKQTNQSLYVTDCLYLLSKLYQTESNYAQAEFYATRALASASANNHKHLASIESLLNELKNVR